eukprot:scaffold203_cov42-Phaeocystis_antarctica.AAC.1
MWSSHHSRSSQKPAGTEASRHAPPPTDTRSRFQSTTMTRKLDSMDIIAGRPPGTTWLTNTKWPSMRASSRASTRSSPPPAWGRLARHSLSSLLTRSNLPSVSPMHRMPSTLQMRRPKNSMHCVGPRRLCGAH